MEKTACKTCFRGSEACIWGRNCWKFFAYWSYSAVTPDWKLSIVTYILVSKVLTYFLQSQDILECFMQPALTSPDVLSDFSHGAFLAQCRDIMQDATCNTIFLLLYTDELVLTNPLGSAAARHKILAVYCSILNIHPRHPSKLSTIHLLLPVVYPAVQQHGLEKVLAFLVWDLRRHWLQEFAFQCCDRSF